MIPYDVLLIGRTPVSAVLATRLADAGRSVALIDDGMSPDVTGSVRWRTLRDLGLGDQTAAGDWPAIRTFKERLLLEDGVLESLYRSERMGDLAHRILIARSEDLNDVLLGSSAAVDHGAATPERFLRDAGRVVGVRFADGHEIRARLTVVTSGNRRLLGATVRGLPDEISPPFFEQIEIAWASRNGECERVAISGQPFAQVNGLGLLLLEAERTTLALLLPARDLVREAVAAPDMLACFLGNAENAEVPLLAEAESASVRLLTLPERADLGGHGPGFAVYGAVQGLCDPASFDRELNLAHAIASELCAAPKERYGSVALQAAIAAVAGMSDWARRQPRREMIHHDADWLLADPDQLGGALARLARLSSSD